MLFSKKRFRAFLLAAGIPKEDVLLRKKRARILKPAFTVIRDKESKCLLVFIRGTQSLKDTLTDAIGAPVSFNHFICSDDGELKRNNKVSGHGHRGMVAAARWIKKHCTTILLEDLRRHPDFQIKGQIKHKKILNAARSAVVSRLPFASTAKAIADHAVTRGTQVVKKHKERTRLLLSLSQQPENVGALSSSKSDNLAEASRSTETSYEVSEEIIISESTSDEDESIFSSDDESQHDDTDEEEQIISAFQNITASTAASDEELLNQLEKLELEKHDDIPNIHVKENQEATTSIDVTEGEKKVVLVHAEESAGAVTASYNLEKHPLYPPGRIMHIVPAPSNSSENSNSDDYDPDEKYLYLYETPKQLYGKLRVSRRMILDHMTNKYLKMIQQLINQLENQS
ncbi:hypothetical protein GLYMA_01G012200v4 [Glycine max]|nr:hypothetical protein GLYMA_01G012200v4 [Glycine max]